MAQQSCDKCENCKGSGLVAGPNEYEVVDCPVCCKWCGRRKNSCMCLGPVDEVPAQEIPAAELSTTARKIAEVCEDVKGMLLAKNKAYGDSALNPLRVFSKVDAVEQLKVRIDDKLSRVLRGSDAGEDVVLDLIGYLILLRIGTEKRND